MHDTLDLSERHLLWFARSLLKSHENIFQAGESTHSTKEEEAYARKNQFAVSQKLNTGGAGFEAACLFANGIGPVREPNENDTTLSDFNKELLYQGKNKTIKYSPDNNLAFSYSSDDDWSVSDEHRFESDYKIQS